MGSVVGRAHGVSGVPHVNEEHRIQNVWDAIYEAQCEDACLHVCGCCVTCTVYVECAFSF